MKNIECNITNQALTFLCSEYRSSAILIKYLESQGRSDRDLFTLFYAYAKILKRHASKYVNRKTLSDISTDTDCERLREIARSPVYSGKLPLAEFCRLARILLHYFLSSKARLAVFASKRIKKSSYPEYIRKWRHILAHLEHESRQLRYLGS